MTVAVNSKIPVNEESSKVKQTLLEKSSVTSLVFLTTNTWLVFWNIALIFFLMFGFLATKPFFLAFVVMMLGASISVAINWGLYRGSSRYATVDQTLKSAKKTAYIASGAWFVVYFTALVLIHG